MSVLRLENVTKTYGDKIAVDNVSFEVNQGAIFGLLGPNGAGKTSLIRIITTITGADSGTVYLNDERLNFDHPAQIGYLPEERGLYKKMKVGDQLIYLARLKGLTAVEAKKAIREWMKRFEILDWWNKKIGELSKGMQQKIQFIATVVHRPKLLILDEPFSGLDPINTNLIKDEIRKLNDEGVSIIFSTHRMEQVEEICEDIVLINNGKNILEGKVAAIKQKHKQNLYSLVVSNGLPDDLEVQQQVIGFDIISKGTNKVVVRLENDLASNQLLSFFLQNGKQIVAFNEILPSLNEIFINEVEKVEGEFSEKHKLSQNG